MDAAAHGSSLPRPYAVTPVLVGPVGRQTSVAGWIIPAPAKRQKWVRRRADTGHVVDQPAHQNRIQSFRTAPDEGSWSGGPSPVSAAHGQTMTRPNGGQGWSGPSPTTQANGRGFDPQRASTAELVSQAVGQMSTLVRSELALAKAEFMEKGRKLGVGAGMLAAAALFGLTTFGMVIALIVAVLDIDWPLWLAVLVPLLVLGLLTLTLAGLGIRRLRAGASPPQAADSVRDDIRSLKQAIRDGRANHHAQHNGHHADDGRHAEHGGRAAAQDGHRS
jgi:hypothetical protein